MLRYTECDCAMWGHIRHPSTLVLHFTNEREAAQAFLESLRSYHCQADGSSIEACRWRSTCDYHANRRYLIICTPHGHVAGVAS